MKKSALIIAAIGISFGLGFYFNKIYSKHQSAISNQSIIDTNNTKTDKMKLGAFSVSLSVKDINISKDFYEKLGFKVFAGDINQNYLIMKNDNALIGLFQGMFDGNILTFNPGWDENAQNIIEFDDVRKIQEHLKNNNINLTTEADENTSGPASITLNDPDGNIILIDQHR